MKRLTCSMTSWGLEIILHVRSLDSGFVDLWWHDGSSVGQKAYPPPHCLQFIGKQEINKMKEIYFIMKLIVDSHRSQLNQTRCGASEDGWTTLGTFQKPSRKGRWGAWRTWSKPHAASSLQNSPAPRTLRPPRQLDRSFRIS